MQRQLLSAIVVVCAALSVCSSGSRPPGKYDKYRRPGSGSSSRTTPRGSAPAGYNEVVERGKFFAAAGPDSELSDKEFASDRSRGNGFVRRTDHWSVLLRYDKNGNKTLDWFEANTYRRAQYGAAANPKPPAGSGFLPERARFFAAAGPDSELSEKEFYSDRTKGTGYVRKTDSWSAMLRYDKNRNRTIDWFEAEAYRRPRSAATGARPATPAPKPAPKPAAPAAASTVVTFGGHRYKVIRKRISWSDAAEECEEHGGYLVTVESAGELAFLKRLAGSSRLWVGATDGEKEGQWEWITGKPVPRDRSVWASGEPNGGKACNYASITIKGLYDSASPYASVSGMICEWDR